MSRIVITVNRTIPDRYICTGFSSANSLSERRPACRLIAVGELKDMTIPIKAASRTTRMKQPIIPEEATTYGKNEWLRVML